MTITSQAPAQQELRASALHLLTPQDAERVARLVVRDNEGVDYQLAVRIVDEALKFIAVAASGKRDGRNLRPSKIVDMGWHALILHTELYRDVCGSLGGFVHHRPEGPETLRRDATTLDQTVDAIRASGYATDDYLWGDKADTEIKGGDCQHTECHQDPGCGAPQAYPTAHLN
ncbi:hypothetical protein ACFYP4_02495 [Streptomyces sp. NPDC005551]|uniref:hypothetical protein n=1 Tax=Streptomyces sp. NPDC005551 TaxID=3364725 RepID=UPI0036B3E077